MSVSRLKLSEVPRFMAWLIANRDRNSFDPEVIDYPTLRVYGSGSGYLPVHSGVILESLALSPDASAEQKLSGVIEMVNAVESEARDAGIRELFYISSDARTDESAVRQLGFEKVVAYRKKIR